MVEEKKFVELRSKNSKLFAMINEKYNFMDEQHVEFPDGHPFKYYLHLMMINFSDRTRTGLFIIVWSFTIYILFIYTISAQHIRIALNMLY